MVLDNHHRLWTWGENKHGQLGREGDKAPLPVRLMVGGEGEEELEVVDVVSGWSHVVALVRRTWTGGHDAGAKDKGYLQVWGWGR